MENLNPCNIQRSLGEIRCLFCFVYLTLIVFLFFFCSCTSCFLRNKNGLWLLKLTPICQGGEESFGLNWKIFIFFCKKKKKRKSVLTVHLLQTGSLLCMDGPELSHLWVLFQFWPRRWSRSLFLPSCAGWCRSLLRCIRMCDVHLVCTYVHNYVKNTQNLFWINIDKRVD